MRWAPSLAAPDAPPFQVYLSGVNLGVVIVWRMCAIDALTMCMFSARFARLWRICAAQVFLHSVLADRPVSYRTSLSNLDSDRPQGARYTDPAQCAHGFDCLNAGVRCARMASAREPGFVGCIRAGDSADSSVLAAPVLPLRHRRPRLAFRWSILAQAAKGSISGGSCRGYCWHSGILYIIKGSTVLIGTSWVSRVSLQYLIEQVAWSREDPT
jgi:hypothetical protein